MSTRQLLKSMILPLRRIRGRGRFSTGQLGSARPLSRDFGYSRGTPIDRYYIERFLTGHSADVRGHVLEIGEDSYSRRFGGERVAKQDVLHVRAGEPRATIVGDLSQPGVLPDRMFDCIIFTQTLHLIFDMGAVIAQLHRSLKPGGVLLATVPGITPVDVGQWKDSWYWSLTEPALGRLLSGPFEPSNVLLSTHGNLLAATAFLHGAAVEEVGCDRLDPVDSAYPVTIAARAVA